MEHELRNHLLALAEAYSAATGKSRTKIAEAAAGDRSFFTRIETSGFTARKWDHVVGWFSDNWPPGASWPTQVPRPKAETTTG
jgi:hypothetical protein